MSYSFDGVDDFLRGPHNDPVVMPSNTFTLAAWVKQTGSNGVNSHILGKAFAGELSYGISMYSFGDFDHAYRYHQYNTTAIDVLTNHAPGIWTHVLATYSGTRSIHHYDPNSDVRESNQHLQGTLAPSYGTAMSRDEFNVGGHPFTSYPYYAGLIAHVSIWSGVLDSGHLSDLEGGVNPLELTLDGGQTLLQYWPLVDGPEGFVSDGSDLVAQGGATLSLDNPDVDDPIPPGPSNLVANAVPSGIDLSWEGENPPYQIQRQYWDSSL